MRPPIAATALTCLRLALAAGPVDAQPAQVTVLDAAGTVGAGSDVAYGPNGRALVSYLDATNGALKVAACQNVACTSAVLHTIDASGAVTGWTSIAFGADGLARIAYQAGNAVRLARCADEACSAAALATVDTVPALWPGTAVGVGGDGVPILAYTPAGLGLRVAHCNDGACGSATVTAYDGSFGVSLTIGGDGRALVAATSSASTRIYHCGDAACTTATVGIIFGVPTSGPSGFAMQDPSLATRPDGTGMVAVTRSPNVGSPRTELYLCGDAGCARPEFTAFPIGAASVAPALAVTADGRTVLASYQVPPGSERLRATICASGHTGCEARSIDAPGIGRQPEIAVGPAGIGLVSYQDEVNGDLKVAYLDGAVPTVGVGDTTAVEGDTGATTVLVPVTLSRAAHATVQFATQPGSAASGVDFQPTSGVLTFSPGAATLNVTVSVLGDLDPEGPETFFVALSGADGVVIADGTGVVTIQDDEALISLSDATAVEGDGGLTFMFFTASLEAPSAAPVAADYTTQGVTATSGVDYIALSGTLSFAPGRTSVVVTSFVVGDLGGEPDETFRLLLSNPQNGVLGDGDGLGTIVDDDPYEPPQPGELRHGASYTGDLAATAGVADDDVFRMAQEPYASYEVVADAVSGDARPLVLERRAPGGAVLQSGAPVGTGSAVGLRWLVAGTAPVPGETVRIAGACGAACGPDDVYRVRTYETTLRAARFNNTGDQTTVVVLANPGDAPVGLTVRCWGPDGTLLGTHTPAGPLSPHGVLVLDTSTFAPGASGSVTVAHDGPYGGLVGKAVALEPSTGFAFDTPFEPQPR
jgi:hypothetical protein